MNVQERLSAIASELSRSKVGKRYPVSDRKRAHALQAGRVGVLMRSGDTEGAERLRWLYWPESMERERIAREAGLK